MNKIVSKNNPTISEKIKYALKLVFNDPLFLVLAVSFSGNLILIFYFIFLQSTTLKVFLEKNNSFYSFASISLTLLISTLLGIVISLVIWQWREMKIKNLGVGSNSFLGGIVGAISIGCPACGAFLLSLLGIGGGLAAFPFQGLEIKALSVLLLGFSLIETSKVIYDKKCSSCETLPKEELLKIKKGDFVFTFNKNTFNSFKPVLAGTAAILLIVFFPVFRAKTNIGFNFQRSTSQASVSNIASDDSLSADSQSTNLESSLSLIDIINPSSGYTVNAKYGDIGPKLLASGAIDLEKLKQIYERSGQPLTDEQIKILTQGLDEKITINRETAYFLINFLWALGLANKNPILDEGPLMQYGGLSKIGNFASTGGWTLGTKPATELYSKSEIIPLNKEEQARLEDFAGNSYRPCCNNSTAFGDCNHGIAALALGEIMASSGASADEMFEALKYFNAFWFPQQYIDLAKYFQAKEGKNWGEVDARVLLGRDFSTASGWSRARNWLASNNLIEQAPQGGGGCGV